MMVDISEESFEFLKQFIEEINTQDNRATANPYFYVIQDVVTRCVPDGCGEETRYYWDSDVLTKEEVEDHLDDGTLIENLIEEGTIEPVDAITERFTPENHNVFFTEKACRAHLKQNGHHFKEPSTYIRHAFRNPEIEKLMKAVREIVGVHNG